jgi:hypothetical protein
MRMVVARWTLGLCCEIDTVMFWLVVEYLNFNICNRCLMEIQNTLKQPIMMPEKQSIPKPKPKGGVFLVWIFVVLYVFHFEKESFSGILHDSI